MLRIDWRTGEIPLDYEDGYLQLIRLLTEAAGLEHSLMVAYLYALFSLKEKYRAVRGDLGEGGYLEHSPAGRGGTEVLFEKETFLAVALEEMQHLSIANLCLVDLCAAPNFTPHVFPFSSDLYPFDIELRSIDRYAAATYLWIEADDCALSLDPACQGRSEPERFIRGVRRLLRRGSPRFRELELVVQTPNHIGSLYRTIVKQLQSVAEKPPKFLPADLPWGEWEAKMNWILHQGEITHYKFFRGIYTGKAFKNTRIWRLKPTDPDYPCHTFTRQTAYTGHKNTIQHPDARRLAWLSNLHYWIILSLLDAGYRGTGLSLRYKAINNMTMGLWHLGRHLAETFSIGLPFDQMGLQYRLGRTPEMDLRIIVLLVKEAHRKAQSLANLLPAGYDLRLFEMTLDGLPA
jgi:ferritin-like protein